MDEKPAATTGFVTSGYAPVSAAGAELADLVVSAVDQLNREPGGVHYYVRAGVNTGVPSSDPDLPPGHRHVMVAILVAARIVEVEVEDVVTAVHQAVSSAWAARWGEDSKPATMPVDGHTWAKARDRATTWSASHEGDEELARVAGEMMVVPADEIPAPEWVKRYRGR